MIWSLGLVQEDSVEVPQEHSLIALWKKVTELWKQAHEGDRSYLDPHTARVSDLITVLGEVDPDSQVFRYPFDKKGELSLADDLHFIDLRQLKAQVSEVSELLDNLWQ